MCNFACPSVKLAHDELHVIWPGYMMISIQVVGEFPLKVRAFAKAVGFLAPKYGDMHAPYTYTINTTGHVEN
jgi:hypothetical protein